MRRWNSFWAVVAVVGLALVAGRTWADDKEDVGNGAKAWAKALLDGDEKAIKAHSIGDDTEMARWEGMSKMIGAFKKLGDAASAKYGEQGAMLSRVFKQPDYEAMQKDSTIAVSGSDATITDKQNKVMKLKKDGGEWKVMLASLNESGPNKMDPKQVAAMAAAASSTADEIKDGKYPTYIEAMRAMGQKMAAAGAGGRRPGAPGAAPAK